MSWGFFLEATLTMKAAQWKSLARARPRDFVTPLGWWGFKDRELERRFIDAYGDVSRGLTFAALVKRFGKNGVGEVKVLGGVAKVRILTLLDRSGDTDIARGVAALFEAAVGAEGAVSLVNDGTYSGEDGVTVTRRDGRLVRSRVKDCNTLIDGLGAELFSGMVESEEAEDVAPSPPNPMGFVMHSAQLAAHGTSAELFRAFEEYLEAGGEVTPGVVCNGVLPILRGHRPDARFVKTLFPAVIEAAMKRAEFRAHDVAVVQLGVAVDALPKLRGVFLKAAAPHLKEGGAGLHAQLLTHAMSAKDSALVAKVMKRIDSALVKTPRYLDGQSYTLNNLAVAAVERGELERALAYLQRFKKADPTEFAAARGDKAWKVLRGDSRFERMFTSR